LALGKSRRGGARLGKERESRDEGKVRGLNNALREVKIRGVGE